MFGVKTVLCYVPTVTFLKWTACLHNYNPLPVVLTFYCIFQSVRVFILLKFETELYARAYHRMPRNAPACYIFMTILNYKTT